MSDLFSNLVARARTIEPVVRPNLASRFDAAVPARTPFVERSVETETPPLASRPPGTTPLPAIAAPPSNRGDEPVAPVAPSLPHSETETTRPPLSPASLESHREDVPVISRPAPANPIVVQQTIVKSPASNPVPSLATSAPARGTPGAPPPSEITSVRPVPIREPAKPAEPSLAASAVSPAEPTLPRAPARPEPASLPLRTPSLALAIARDVPSPRPQKSESAAAALAAPPEIHVTIGRLEIRALVPPAPAAGERPVPASGRLSLDDYLRNGKGGAR